MEDGFHQIQSQIVFAQVCVCAFACNIVSIAMWSLVMYFNCFIKYYQLMLHVSIIKICSMHQDTRSCVSGQESRVTHKCIIYRNH